jgi:hypothetical protein
MSIWVRSLALSFLPRSLGRFEAGEGTDAEILFAPSLILLYSRTLQAKNDFAQSQHHITAVRRASY